MERTPDGSGYGKAVAVRATGPPPRAHSAPAGVVIRSVSTSDDRFPHTGATRYRDDAPRIPAFAIANPDADALERQFASGKPVRLACGVPRASCRRRAPPTSSARFPAPTLPRKSCMLGAHLDSWDPGVGAIDNGAGVAITMGVAHLIRQRGPEAPAHHPRGVVRE